MKPFNLIKIFPLLSILFILITLSTSLFASESANIVDKAQFNQMMSVESAQMIPWNYSNSTCQAYTRCANGLVASCQTFGYTGVPRQFRISCSGAVWPGRGVRWQGYAQVRDFFGRFVWTYVDVPVSCF